MPVSTCKINQLFLQMSLCALPTPTASVCAGLRAQRGSRNVGDAASHRNPWNGILSSSGFCSSLRAKSNINNIQSTFPYVDIFIKPQSLSLLYFSVALVSYTYCILTKVNSSVALWNVTSNLWTFLKVSDFVSLASTSKCVWSPSHVALFIVETPHFAEEHISLLKKIKKCFIKEKASEDSVAPKHLCARKKCLCPFSLMISWVLLVKTESKETRTDA